jgi:hypothetical protein
VITILVVFRQRDLLQECVIDLARAGAIQRLVVVAIVYSDVYVALSIIGCRCLDLFMYRSGAKVLQWLVCYYHTTFNETVEKMSCEVPHPVVIMSEHITNFQRRILS